MKGIYQKFGVVLLVAAVFSSPIRGTGIEIGAAGAILGSLLAPMIAPMIEEIKEEAEKRIAGVMRDLKRVNGCNTICNTRISCKSARIATICKSRCQKRINVGEYTLKIRYRNADEKGPSWNLQQCVKAAPDKPNKVKDIKEIAIYGDENYRFAIDMIAEITALDKFIVLGGQIPRAKEKEDGKEDDKKGSKKRSKKGSKEESSKPVEKTLTREERLKLVAEAEQDREAIEKAFEKHVRTKFGPQ